MSETAPPRPAELDAADARRRSAPVELVFRPASAFAVQDLLDIWRYRELLWVLGMRDVRVRYKQAGFGVAWALIQPLTQMVIFTVLFNRVVGIRADSGVPYGLFTFSGLIVWTLFANGLSQASDSLVQNGDLVTKVYFPRAILPLAAVLAACIDFAVGLALLLLMMLASGAHFGREAFLIAPIAVLSAFAAVSISFWTSAINIEYRDVRYVLPFFFQILIYLTPVFYPSSIVPERYRLLVELNPMAAVVDSFRSALFGTPIPWGRLSVAAAVVVLLGCGGFAYFRQREQTFADRL
jgi:lipopolysaccharide transport system permease protein